MPNPLELLPKPPELLPKPPELLPKPPGLPKPLEFPKGEPPVPFKGLVPGMLAFMLPPMEAILSIRAICTSDV